MRALRAVRDAARLDDMAKQAEIGQVEAHRGSSFVFREGKLRQILSIMSHIIAYDTS